MDEAHATDVLTVVLWKDCNGKAGLQEQGEADLLLTLHLRGHRCQIKPISSNQSCDAHADVEL